MKDERFFTKSRKRREKSPSKSFCSVIVVATNDITNYLLLCLAIFLQILLDLFNVLFKIHNSHSQSVTVCFED